MLLKQVLDLINVRMRTWNIGQILESKVLLIVSNTASAVDGIFDFTILASNFGCNQL